MPDDQGRVVVKLTKDSVEVVNKFREHNKKYNMTYATAANHIIVGHGEVVKAAQRNLRLTLMEQMNRFGRLYALAIAWAIQFGYDGCTDEPKGGKCEVTFLDRNGMEVTLHNGKKIHVDIDKTLREAEKVLSKDYQQKMKNKTDWDRDIFGTTSGPIFDA